MLGESSGVYSWRGSFAIRERLTLSWFIEDVVGVRGGVLRGY